MKSLPNIAKSYFDKPNYVGYAAGVWRVRRTGRKLWQATHRSDTCAPVLTAPRLIDISDQLAAYAVMIESGHKVY